MMEKLLKQIIVEARKYLVNLDEEKIRKAYEFALDCHGEQKRFSGEPYIIHPLQAALILLRMMPDTDTICACIMHDTIEDDRLERDQELLKVITKEFGADVAQIVDGVSKLGRIKYRGKEREIESLRKMFVAMAYDVRVVLVRLADRLHNMRTLTFVPKHKQERIARETLEIYVPVAGRIGVYEIKKDLEDQCFLMLHPEEYKRINEELGKSKAGLEKQIKIGVNKISKLLDQNNIFADVSGRIKNPYSVYKKMRKKGFTSSDQVMDIFALRIIVDDVQTCYAVLGLLHTAYKPVPDRFKDYIAKPKLNGYQSLHTDLLDLLDKTTEIQIRTTEMHRQAEYGLAAHWNYKEKQSSIVVPKEQRNWLSDILSRDKKEKDSDHFVSDLKLDFFDDEVFVYTPSGDVKALPEGSTPVDFAYSVHTDVGHMIKGAKVDGKIVPLDYRLKNGETIEVLTKKEPSPSQYWLSFVKTSGAREKIRHYLSSQDREKNIRNGINLFNDYLVGAGKEKMDGKHSVLTKVDGSTLNMTEREDILEKVGNGALSSAALYKKVYGESARTKRKKKTAKVEVKKNSKLGVVVGGETGLKVKFASCCDPKPKVPIFAYSTAGEGITIHRKDCHYKNILNPERVLPAYWEGEEVDSRVIKLDIYLDYTPGLLGSVLNGLYESGVEVQSVQSAYDGDEKILKVEMFTHNQKEIDLVNNYLANNKNIKRYNF